MKTKFIFLTLFLLGLVLKGQSPGGVSSGLQLWLPAENYTGGATWTDASGNGRNATKVGTVSNTILYNFNNVASNLNNANYFSVAHNASLNTNNGAISAFVVGLPGSTSATFGPFMHKSNAGWTSGWILGVDNPTTTGFMCSSNYASRATRSGLSTTIPYILSGFGSGGGASNTVSISNNANSETTATDGNLSSTSNLNIGYDGVNGAGRSLQGGGIAEAIMYNGNLTAAQKLQIQSYLAIKYGITLNSGTSNYINSSTAVLWNSATNAGYNNNIAGIARDNGSNLHQKQSMSINGGGQQILIGNAGAMASTNSLNTNAMTNGQSLIWGDNGLARSMGVAVTGMSSVNSRFNAIWKVQNTGSVGIVRIAYPVGVSNPYLLVSNDASFDGSDTAYSMSGTFVLNSVTYNYVDVTLSDGQYFTIGNYSYGPGGVGAGIRAWYKADAITGTDASSVTAWNDATSNGMNLNIVAGTAPVLYTSTAAQLVNFNPSVKFNGNGGLTNSNAGTPPASANLFASTSPYAFGGVIVDEKTNTNHGCIYEAAIYDEFTFHKQSGATASNGWNVFRNGTNESLVNGSNSSTNIGPNGFSPSGGSNGVYNGTNYTAYTALQPQNYLITGANTDGTSQSNFVDGYKTIRTGLNINLRTTNWFKRYSIGAYYNNQFQFTGRIPEEFIYGRELSDSEVQRVSTYLAIKYGSTLGQGGTNASSNVNKNHNNYNYVASDGVVVWNATVNSTYSSNIAGIARDDASALKQSQSNSTNDNNGKQVLIGIKGLSNTNALNIVAGNDFTADQQYLIWGDNGKGKQLEVPISGHSPANFRFGAIWKVQNRNSVGVVRVAWPGSLTNMKLVVSNDAVFDAADTSYDMVANTQVINGVTYKYADVTLADGQYFTFAGFATAPGGVVTNLKLWVKPDAGVTTSGSNVTSWANQASSGLSFTQTTTSRQPLLATNYMNFNPSINFTGAKDMYMLGANPTLFAPSSPQSYFYIANSTSVAGNRTITETHTGSGDLPTFEWSGTSFRMNINGSNYNHQTKTVTANTPYIIASAFNNTNVGGQYYNMYNGAFQNVVAANTSVSVQNNIYLASNGGGEFFEGNIPELIGYDSYLTNATDIQKIHSYLALKYGFTLDQTVPLDYLNSNGTIVWNGTTNVAYNKNIAGIIRDDLSALHQKQSQSVNQGLQQLLIGYGGALASTNATNSNAMTDGQSLVWGGNGGSRSLTNPILGIIGVNYTFGAVWKAQNTGNVGTVRVMWPQGIVNLRFIQSTDNVFTSSDVITDMSANTQVLNSVTYNYADVTIADGQYFTFAGLGTVGPGGVQKPDLWVKSDDPGTINTAWKDQSDNANPVENVGGITLSSADKAHNFHAFTSGYTSTKYFKEIATTFAPAAAYVQQSVSVYSAVRNSSLSEGRITGVDNEPTNSAEPYLSLTNSGKARFFKFTGTTQSLETTATYPTTQSHLPYFISNDVTKNILVGIDGNENNTTVAASQTFGTWGTNLLIGYGSYDVNAAFPGDIMEVVWYTRALTTNESDRLNSYLAIKNGTTFTKNYLASFGSTVWDRAVNTAFNNNIFGVAYDTGGTLNQKVSNSVNPNTILTVATTKDFTSSNEAVSRTTLNDGDFVLLGDNQLPGISVMNPVDCPVFADGLVRLNRVWLVQKKGSPGNLWYELDLNAYGINDQVSIYTSDDENFTSVKATFPVTMVAGKAVFKYDFLNGKYFTIVGKVGAPACASCKGKNMIIRQGSSWNGAAVRLANDTGVFSVGTDEEGNVITARNTITYATPSNEYIPAWYPAPYGNSALMGRHDITNGAAGKTTYVTEVSKAGKISFDLTGINTWYGNSVKVVVTGYCGGNVVNPIISPKVTGPYSYYNSYVITGNSVLGNKYYQGYNDYSTVKVKFKSNVEKIKIEWTVERNPAYMTGYWLMIGDMTMECESPLEPNIDNVYIKQSFDNDNIPACNEATMKMNVKNLNCNDRTINIANNLPAGIEYVTGSYSGLGSETPTYSGQNFNLSNFVVPSGETDLYIKVRPTNPSIPTTTYNTQSSYDVTTASGGTGATILSDNTSIQEGLQVTDLTFTAATKPAMPNVTFTSTGDQTSCGIINYTITIDNTNINQTLSNLILQPNLNLGQIITGSIQLSSGLSGTIQPISYGGQPGFLIPDLSLNTIANNHTITFQTQVTQIDELAKNNVELFIDPAVNSCALAAKVTVKLGDPCPTCIGGKGVLKNNEAWWYAGQSSRDSNSISDVNVGTVQSGNLKADVSVDYSTNNVQEWYGSSFPRWNGQWTELSRYDNKSGAAGMVTYKVNLKDNANMPIGSKPSFQIAGIVNKWGQANKVKIVGYCGTTEVQPILNYANNYQPDYYNRYTIVNNTAVGTKPWYELYSWATVNVEFTKTIDRIEIQWTVDRSPVYTTAEFIYVGQMKFVCENELEPNPDNVHVLSSFVEEDLLTCTEATLKLQLKNMNCSSKNINLNNVLPSNLTYIPNSFVGSGGTPTYSGQNFTGTFAVPSGNSFMYIKVKPTDPSVGGTYSTQGNYTVSGGINTPSPYLTDDLSGTTGYQATSINYTAEPSLPKPIVTKTVNQCYVAAPSGNGTTLTYTVKVVNNTNATMNNVEFRENLAGDQEFVSGSLSVSGGLTGGVPTDYATDKKILLVQGLTISANSSGTIVYQVYARNSAPTLSNVASFTVNPSSSCSSANTFYSDEVKLGECPLIDSDGDGIPDSFDLDDDNDGILDTAECYEYVTRPGSVTSTVGTIAFGNGSQLMDGEGTNSIIGDSGPTPHSYWEENNNPITFNISMNTASNISNILFHTPNGFDEQVKDFKVEFYNGATQIGSAYFGALPPAYTTSYSLNLGTTYSNVTNVRFTVLSGQGLSASNPKRVSLKELVFRDIAVCDTDSDGIPNVIDLDSDADGCPDALEGAGNVTQDMLNPNNSINTNITGNIDAEGVPNAVNPGGIADSDGVVGQAIGDSQNSAVSTQCLDSDADGVPDIADLDDDNDGILDSVECPALYSFAQFNFAGSPIGTASLPSGGTVSINLLYSYTKNGVNAPFVSSPGYPKGLAAPHFQDKLATDSNLFAKVGSLSGASSALYQWSQSGTTGDIRKVTEYDFTTTTKGYADDRIFFGISGNYPDVFGFYDDEIKFTAIKMDNTLETDYSEWRLIQPTNSNQINDANGINEGDIFYEGISATAAGFIVDMANVNQNEYSEGIDSTTGFIFLPPNKQYKKVYFERHLNASGNIYMPANVVAAENEYSSIMLGEKAPICDVDNDGIPNELDLDSDNDGCVDAMEGDENVSTSQLVAAGGTVTVGTGSTATNINLCAFSSCININGVPTIVNSGGLADIGGDVGQGIGGSQNALINLCPTFCYKPGATVGTTLNTNLGITALGRAGVADGNWPMVRKGAWMALEAKTKGFVLNRVAFSDADGNPITPDVPTGIPALNFVEGMIVYDTTNNVLKVYTSVDGGVTFAWYSMNTQACPD